MKEAGSITNNTEMANLSTKTEKSRSANGKMDDRTSPLTSDDDLSIT